MSEDKIPCPRCNGHKMILTILPDDVGSPMEVPCKKCEGTGYLINGHPATPLTVAVRDVVNEYKKAIKVYPPFKSYHEGYSIILEELDELWDEVKKKDLAREREKLREEVIQLAAMALRFAVDLTSSTSDDSNESVRKQVYQRAGG